MFYILCTNKCTIRTKYNIMSYNNLLVQRLFARSEAAQSRIRKRRKRNIYYSSRVDVEQWI